MSSNIKSDLSQYASIFVVLYIILIKISNNELIQPKIISSLHSAQLFPSKHQHAETGDYLSIFVLFLDIMV